MTLTLQKSRVGSIQRFVKASVLSLLLSILLQTAGAETLPNLMWGRSVVKVMADSKQGRVSMGSGVVVSPNRVATNCHVTRAASSVIVSKGISRYRVIAQSAMPERDICILHTAGLKLPTARLGSVSKADIGKPVFIFGFPAAVGLGVVRGIVRELHPIGDDYILETDAGFMHGTSGGALFTAQGELIALPTFMVNDEDGGQFYAVPVEWINEALQQPSAPVAKLNGQAFWETGGFVKKSNR